MVNFEHVIAGWVVHWYSTRICAAHGSMKEFDEKCVILGAAKHFQC